MKAMLMGFIGGILAWFITTFVTKPLVGFFSAREEVSKVLARYEYLDVYRPDVDESSTGISDVREKLLAEPGAQLVAFAQSNQYLVRIIQKFGFDPQKAGNELLHLSKIKPHGRDNADLRDKIMGHLKLGRRF